MNYETLELAIGKRVLLNKKRTEVLISFTNRIGAITESKLQTAEYGGTIKMYLGKEHPKNGERMEDIDVIYKLSFKFDPNPIIIEARVRIVEVDFDNKEYDFYIDDNLIGLPKEIDFVDNFCDKLIESFYDKINNY